MCTFATEPKLTLGELVKSVVVVIVKLPALMFPAINEVIVPTEVMFGWAAVVNVPVKKFAVTRLPRLAFAADKLPVIDTALVVLLKVNPALPPKLLLSLN